MFSADLRCHSHRQRCCCHQVLHLLLVLPRLGSASSVQRTPQEHELVLTNITTWGPAARRFVEQRTPQEIAKDRASYLLDLAVAQPEEYSWESIRPDLAALYREAGMSSIGTFVECEQS